VLASSAKDYVLSAKENGLKCIVRIPGKSTGNGLDVRIKELINTNNTFAGIWMMNRKAGASCRYIYGNGATTSIVLMKTNLLAWHW
jgi:hypothetical protein